MYGTTNSTESLATALDQLELHAADTFGFCRSCEVRPCPHRETAIAIFSRYSRLPRRTPGANLPDWARETPVPFASWFGGAR